MRDFLKTILKQKKKEVVLLKKRIDLAEIKKDISRQSPQFKKAIAKKSLNIIAEIKKASPSKGVIVKGFDHKKIALVYEKLKISAISVLTEKEFGGNISYLRDVKEVSSLPLLRKDFIIDEYQIYESKLAGADAILLIARILSARKLKQFLSIAKSIGLDSLVEVHNRQDLAKALKAGTEIIGINNRDLSTFKTDLSITKNLIKFIPKNKIIVSESGVGSREDLLFLKKLGVNAVLIGEAFLKLASAEKIKKLIG